MAHELESARDIAYAGETPWHGMGTKLGEGESLETWAKAAGLDWSAEFSPAYARLPFKGDAAPAGSIATGKQGDARFGLVEVPNRVHLYRSDNARVLGTFSDSYKVHQPADILAFFADYVLADERFSMEVAGALRGGAVIWALAKFRNDATIGGDRHVAHCLLTTAFDGTSATKAAATMTRVVCRNTLRLALSQDKGAQISVSHRSKFDDARRALAAKQLADIAQGFEQFKAMGDALAGVQMSKAEVESFFRKLADIPETADMANDVSAKRRNTLARLYDALGVTLGERGEVTVSRFAALQAVTRFVDHDRNTRGGDESTPAGNRLYAAQFGDGARMKGDALALLAAA
jgi:phage/plasmid-like protein (TIGR03299 family)